MSIVDEKRIREITKNLKEIERLSNVLNENSFQGKTKRLFLSSSLINDNDRFELEIPNLLVSLRQLLIRHHSLKVNR